MRAARAALALLPFLAACDMVPHPDGPDIITARAQCDMMDYQLEAVVSDPDGIDDVQWGVVDIAWAGSGDQVDEVLLEPSEEEPGHWSLTVDGFDAPEPCSDDMEAWFEFRDAAGHRSWRRVDVAEWL